MASLLMLLTAVDEGLGACFFGIMPEHLPPFRAEFGVPDEYDPIGGITVGYRAEDMPPQGLVSGGAQAWGGRSHSPRTLGTPRLSCGAHPPGPSRVAPRRTPVR